MVGYNELYAIRQWQNNLIAHSSDLKSIMCVIFNLEGHPDYYNCQSYTYCDYSSIYLITYYRLLVIWGAKLESSPLSDTLHINTAE